jgi:hypothetical protein
MPAFFVEESDLIEFPLYCRTVTNRYGFTKSYPLEDDEGKKLAEDPKTSSQIEVLHSKWKPMDWQSEQDGLQASTYYNGAKGQDDINWYTYRDLRLKNSLIEWDLKDKNGEPIPVTPESINKLHKDIANALINKFDRILAAAQEELGK